jgi:hypothetical protein
MKSFLAALAVLILTAASEPPAPGPGVGSSPQQSDNSTPTSPPAQDQRGTEKSPLFIKQVETLEDKARAARDAENENHQAANESTTNEIAIGALLAAILQFGALAWTIAEMRRTAKRQLRAYIHVSEAFLKWDEKAGQWVAEFQYRNSGQTPAYDVVVSAGMAIKNAEDPHPPWIFKEPWRIGVVGPNGDRFWDGQELVRTADTTLVELKAALEGQSKEVFLFGIIDYRDEFDSARWTSFCYSMGGELGFPDKHMSACQVGNATENSKPPHGRPPSVYVEQPPKRQKSAIAKSAT